MSWTLCTSGAAIAKAGEHVSSDVIDCTTASISAGRLDNWSDEAEGAFCFDTNTDFITNHSTLSSALSGAVGAAVSSKIAMMIIGADTTGYLSREADALLNLNDEVYSKAVSSLKGKADTLKTP